MHTHTHEDNITLLFSSPLQEHDCSLTREIVELVDREADLLVRGMKDETLQGTRFSDENRYRLVLNINFSMFNFCREK
jgi:hypothetical protein